MISFIGLDFQPGRASAAALGQDLSVPARTSAAVAGGYEEDGTGVQCIPPAEWLRAGGFALQELYCGLPLKSRKIWGLGLSGPTGWIALDLDFEPLCDLRLPPAAGLLDDLRDWLSRNPRLEPRISLILSPKDLFRFRMSGALAADATSACALSRAGTFLSSPTYHATAHGTRNNSHFTACQGTRFSLAPEPSATPNALRVDCSRTFQMNPSK